MAVTVEDWGYSRSSSFLSSLHPVPPEEQVLVVSGEGPSVLWRDSTVVEGWNTTVTRCGVLRCGR